LLCGGFCLAGRCFVFGLFLQAEGLQLVGVFAELRDDLFFDRQHEVVELPFGGCGCVSRGCQRILDGKFSVLLQDDNLPL